MPLCDNMAVYDGSEVTVEGHPFLPVAIKEKDNTLDILDLMVWNQIESIAYGK
jgi:hypothetical protein